MYNWTDVPMENLSDLIDWHQHHLSLAQKRFASRSQDPRYAEFPRQVALKQRLDQRQIDHHNRVLGILKPLAERITGLENRNRRLEHMELMTQAALL